MGIYMRACASARTRTRRPDGRLADSGSRLYTDAEYSTSALDMEGIPFPMSNNSLSNSSLSVTVNNSIKRVHMTNRIDTHIVYTLMQNRKV